MMVTQERADIVVIGAGIAGASVAANLAGNTKVVIIEQEPFPGMHSTGRSAATFSSVYGNFTIRALCRASFSFFTSPPSVFGDTPLLHSRGALFVASDEQRHHLEELTSQPDVAAGTEILSTDAALEKCPILKPESVALALYDANTLDVEVDLLLRGYIKQFKAAGGSLFASQRVTGICWRGSDWEIETPERTVIAPIVVNAAGAWADDIGKLAGGTSIGLRPLRRTAILVDPPDRHDISSWPIVATADESCYFKPDAGRLLLSPADETPTPPCDAQPETVDIAYAVDRVQRIADIDVRHVAHSWAGLRSFVEDRTPVVGYDNQLQNFFWLAGQGGYGVQTAPALGQSAASLVRRQPIPKHIADEGITAESLSPQRLRD